ncbi:hypothetical protein O3S80_33995 [Streptomyces sp. Lzd4kr]|nr:hypothetical protein [Streptomyces sp. Lzd4kr]
MRSTAQLVSTARKVPAGTYEISGYAGGWKQTELPFTAFTSRTDGVPRGLSRRTARGGMPCGCRSRWVPATGTGAFARSIR